MCMGFFGGVTGFKWDAGNSHKNLIKHGVTNEESEEAFADEKRIVREDKGHSLTETRHFLLGKTNQNRLLFISFTIRGGMIRVISARDVNKKEQTYYKKQ